MFSRLTRYQPLAKHAQRENQHTEALAATLEADPVFLRLWVARCLEADKAELAWGEGRMRTQVNAGDGRHADLEICVGPPGLPDVRIWVEVKVWTRELSGDEQLKLYAQELRQQPARDCRLVHLRHPNSEPVAESDRPKGGLVELTWQDVGRCARAAALEQRQNPNSITKDLLHFLTEGALAMTEPITPLDLLVAEQQPYTLQAWTGLIDETLRQLRQRWQGTMDDEEVKPTPFSFEKNGGKFWHVCARPDQRTRGGAYCEWTLRTSEHVPNLGLWFYAGVTVWSPDKELWETLRQPAQQGAFELFEAQDVQALRIFRCRPAANLLSHGTLDEQVSKLAEWACTGMREAAEVLRSSSAWREPEG